MQDKSIEAYLSFHLASNLSWRTQTPPLSSTPPLLSPTPSCPFPSPSSFPSLPMGRDMNPKSSPSLASMQGREEGPLPPITNVRSASGELLLFGQIQEETSTRLRSDHSATQRRVPQNQRTPHGLFMPSPLATVPSHRAAETTQRYQSIQYPITPQTRTFNIKVTAVYQTSCSCKPMLVFHFDALHHLLPYKPCQI